MFNFQVAYSARGGHSDLFLDTYQWEIWVGDWRREKEERKALSFINLELVLFLSLI